MEDSRITGVAPVAKRVVPYIVAVVVAGDPAGKHCVRAGGLPECGGMQDNLFVATVSTGR